MRPRAAAAFPKHVAHIEVRAGQGEVALLRERDDLLEFCEVSRPPGQAKPSRPTFSAGRRSSLAFSTVVRIRWCLTSWVVRLRRSACTCEVSRPRRRNAQPCRMFKLRRLFFFFFLAVQGRFAFGMQPLATTTLYRSIIPVATACLRLSGKFMRPRGPRLPPDLSPQSPHFLMAVVGAASQASLSDAFETVTGSDHSLSCLQGLDARRVGRPLPLSSAASPAGLGTRQWPRQSEGPNDLLAAAAAAATATPAAAAMPSSSNRGVSCAHCRAAWADGRRLAQEVWAAPPRAKHRTVP